MKKRALTLLEIMIVIFLITLITGAIGYNMRGALDKGKIFRTVQAKDQLHDLLLICLHEGDKAEDIATKPVEALTKLGLAKDPEHLVLDGWNTKFDIKPTADKLDFTIESSHMPN
jgi:hypothetical protein